MKHLVDSDILISALKGDRAAHDLIDEVVPAGPAVSAASVAEVLEGAYGTSNPEPHLASARQFLAGFTALDVTGEVAAIFARNRALLRQQGQLIPDMDFLIASTAIVHDLSLLTWNHRHFARVPGLKLYLEPN